MSHSVQQMSLFSGLLKIQKKGNYLNNYFNCTSLKKMRWVNELMDLQNLQEVASCNIYSDQDVSGLKMANGPVLVLLPLYYRLFL